MPDITKLTETSQILPQTIHRGTLHVISSAAYVSLRRVVHKERPHIGKGILVKCGHLRIGVKDFAQASRGLLLFTKNMFCERSEWVSVN